MPTSFSATSAARAAPPLPSSVTLPMRRLRVAQLRSASVAMAPTSVFAGDQLALAHHQHIGRAGGDGPVGRAIRQRDGVELQRHGDVGPAPCGSARFSAR